jgi:HEAT repeat protein
MGGVIQPGLEVGGDRSPLLPERRESPPSSPGASDEGGAFPSDEAEVHYQRLGRWRGADASPEVQAESLRFWRGSGLGGIRWLIARLRDDSHDDRLRGAASMLADLGMESLGPILETLRDRPTADQALALLWALGWLGDRERSGEPQTALVLVQYLLDESPELREAAARALRLIPPDHARTWLTCRLRDELDGEVKRTIEEELEAVGAIEELPRPYGQARSRTRSALTRH